VSSNVFELPAHDSEAPRDLTPADWARLEQNAAEIFEALGLDLDTPGTRDTPRRFVRALFDATAGYDGDPKLRTVFPTERPEGVEGRHAQIVEGPVGFYALCEHHALPFHGRAYIGYVAGDEILGISKRKRSPTGCASSPARAASRSGSRRRTCAPLCAASRRTAPSPSPRSGAACTTRATPCAPSSLR
jgi:hypothetical protein